MKKRNLNAFVLKKTTVSKFVYGGLHIDSDNACPTAISCNSVCFCVTSACPPQASVAVNTPVGSETQVGSLHVNAPVGNVNTEGNANAAN